jgi:GT2 family glycosyltransferase
MSDPTLPPTPTPATADAEAAASAESVHEIYAALAPDKLDGSAPRPDEVAVADEVLARQVVHVLVVAHDGEAWLPRTLHALSRVEGPVVSVHAVDTGSMDASARLLADHGSVTTVQAAARDVGYPEAVAMAAAEVPRSPGSQGQPDSAEWLWLLHDDSAPHPDALRWLLAAAIEHDAAVVGAKALDWAGTRRLVEMGVSITGSGRRYIGLEQLEFDQGQHDDRLDVLAVGTAGMLVRRDVWDELGGLDPQIDLFRDDVDFGWRAHLAGHRVVVAPRAVVEHVAAAGHGRRRSGAVRDRPPLVDRRNAAHVLLANAGRWAFVPVLLRLLLGSTLRSLGFVLGKVPGLAWDEAVAIRGAMSPRRVRQARRWRREQPRGGTIRGLRPTIGTQLSQALENASGLMAGTGSGQDVREARRRAVPVPVPDTDEADLATLAATDSWRSRAVAAPGVWVVVGVGVSVLLAARTILVGGPLVGGALLPAPAVAGDWWSSYLGSWHPVGLGSAIGAPPWLGVLSGWAIPVFGSAAALISVLILLAVPMATATAWWSLRDAAPSWPVRAWTSITYGVLVLGSGAIAAGRLGTAVTAVLAPPLARAVVRALRPSAPLRLAWSASFVLAIASAFTPIVWPIVTVAAGVGVAAWVRTRGGLVRWAIVVLTPALLLLPWLGQLWARPALLATEPGLTGRGSELSELDLPAWAPLLLGTGGPGSLPLGLLVAVPVLAGAALLRRPSRTAVIGWTVAVSAVAAGVLTSRVEVSTPAGEGSAAGWPGPAVVVAGLGMLVAVVGSVDLVDLRRHGRVPVVVLAVVAIGTTAVAAAFGLSRSVVDPLDRVDPRLLPAYVADEAAGPEQVRTLVLRGQESGATPSVQYTLLRAESPRMGDAEVLDPVSSRLVGDVVSDVLAGRAPAAGRLVAYGIKYVYAPQPADPALVERLDGQAGLVRASAPDGGAVWRVDGTVARVGVLTSAESREEPAGVVVPSDSVTVRASIEVPAASTVVVAELDDSGWTATLDGDPLTRVSDDGLLAFELPAGTGELRIEHRDTSRDWLLAGQGAALLVVTVLMLPSVGATRDSLDGRRS